MQDFTTLGTRLVQTLTLPLIKLGVIHKGYPIFWPILDLLTYLGISDFCAQF